MQIKGLSLYLLSILISISRLEADIFPALGYKPINNITAPDLLSVIRKIEEREAHDVAKRATQVCGQIFRFGIVTGRCAYNPSGDLRGALKAYPKGHYASIKPDELHALMQAINKNEARLYRHTVLAIKLMALTFVRTPAHAEKTFSTNELLEDKTHEREWLDTRTPTEAVRSD